MLLPIIEAHQVDYGLYQDEYDESDSCFLCRIHAVFFFFPTISAQNEFVPGDA